MKYFTRAFTVVVPEEVWLQVQLKAKLADRPVSRILRNAIEIGLGMVEAGEQATRPSRGAGAKVVEPAVPSPESSVNGFDPD